jgi:hypothetical protein
VIRKVHIPRWSVRGVPLATFHPKTSTRFNCRTSPLFCRKWRGLRWRGRAMLLRRAELERAEAAVRNRPVWISGYKQVTL